MLARVRGGGVCAWVCVRAVVWFEFFAVPVETTVVLVAAVPTVFVLVVERETSSEDARGVTRNFEAWENNAFFHRSIDGLRSSGWSFDGDDLVRAGEFDLSLSLLLPQRLPLPPFFKPELPRFKVELFAELCFWSSESVLFCLEFLRRSSALNLRIGPFILSFIPCVDADARGGSCVRGILTI